jgi:hypothetical protein
LGSDDIEKRDKNVFDAVFVNAANKRVYIWRRICDNTHAAEQICE